MTKKQPAPRGRRPIDWDAVERDFRTTRLTDTELAGKHGATREAIVRRRKKDCAADPTRWQRDLAPEVRRATSALLLKESITQQITDGHRQITDAVMSAAEQGKQIILEHRRALKELADDAATAKAKLLALSANVADVREAAVVVSSLESLGRLRKTIIDKQREAFGLNDTGTPPPAEVPDLAAVPPERRQGAYLELVAQAGRRVA